MQQTIIVHHCVSDSCFMIFTFSVQYYKQTEAYKVTLHYMNTTLTGLFTLECVMKIFSFGFRVCRDNRASNDREKMMRVISR